MQVAQSLKERYMPGERFEAVYKVQVDNDVVALGRVTSVPWLYGAT